MTDLPDFSSALPEVDLTSSIDNVVPEVNLAEAFDASSVLPEAEKLAFDSGELDFGNLEEYSGESLPTFPGAIETVPETNLVAEPDLPSPTPAEPQLAAEPQTLHQEAPKITDTKTIIDNAFKSYDRDGNGAITTGELLAMKDKIGANFTEEEAKIIEKTVRANATGFLPKLDKAAFERVAQQLQESGFSAERFAVNPTEVTGISGTMLAQR